MARPAGPLAGDVPARAADAVVERRLVQLGVRRTSWSRRFRRLRQRWRERRRNERAPDRGGDVRRGWRLSAARVSTPLVFPAFCHAVDALRGERRARHRARSLIRHGDGREARFGYARVPHAYGDAESNASPPPNGGAGGDGARRHSKGSKRTAARAALPGAADVRVRSLDSHGNAVFASPGFLLSARNRCPSVVGSRCGGRRCPTTRTPWPRSSTSWPTPAPGHDALDAAAEPGRPATRWRRRAGRAEGRGRARRCERSARLERPRRWVCRERHQNGGNGGRRGRAQSSSEQARELRRARFVLRRRDR